jgi:hypothetical protein
MKHIPDEKQVENLLENFLPNTSERLDQRLSTAPWTPRAVARYRFINVIAFLILTFALLVAITPPGRAFAQSLFRFFSLAESTSFPLPEEDLYLFDTTPTPAPTFELSLATVSPSNSEPVEMTTVPLPTSSSAKDILKNCKAAPDTSSYACQIALAESQVGFDVREFPTVPRGYAFVSAQINATLRSVTINYSVFEGGGYLTLVQGEGSIPPTSSWGEVRANAIQKVKVNESYGEYAQGMFAVLPGAKSATWIADSATYRLRWVEGNRWFALSKDGNTAPVEGLDKDALIALASNLVDSPDPQANTTLDDSYKLSVVEAETTAGFDLLEPSILPEGFEFAYARYDATYQTVTLVYTPAGQPGTGDGGLYIFQTPRSIAGDPTDCVECPAGSKEQVQVNGAPAYYLHGSFFTGSSDQPLSTPVWQADSPNYNLTWATPDLVININYGVSMWYGGQIYKDDLIKIAESMR